MKKSDIAMIILVASVSIIASFFIVKSLPFFGTPEEGVEVPTITAITSDVTDPDPEVFNSKAINPTVQSVIGGGSVDNSLD